MTDWPPATDVWAVWTRTDLGQIWSSGRPVCCPQGQCHLVCWIAYLWHVVPPPHCWRHSLCTPWPMLCLCRHPDGNVCSFLTLFGWSRNTHKYIMYDIPELNQSNLIATMFVYHSNATGYLFILNICRRVSVLFITCRATCIICYLIWFSYIISFRFQVKDIDNQLYNNSVLK